MDWEARREFHDGWWLTARMEWNIILDGVGEMITQGIYTAQQINSSKDQNKVVVVTPIQM